MRSQAGFTLAEMAVALAIIALMAGLAVIAGHSVIQSAQTSRAASALLDDIALARARAIARSETWRIRFIDPPAGSTAVRQYQVESCAAAPCAWLPHGLPVELKDGMGIGIAFSGGSPITLDWAPSGRFGRQALTPVAICRIETAPGGALSCKPGTGRTIRIHGNTGVIET